MRWPPNVSYVRFRGLAFRLGFFLVGISIRSFGMQLLPFTTEGGGFVVGSQNISGNGKVVTGYSGLTAFYWSFATGQVALPIAEGGNRWGPCHRLNFDGSIITGAGRVINGYPMAQAWTWKSGTGVQAIGGMGSGGDFENIGVTPDSSYIVRKSLSHLTTRVVYRDYPSGLSSLWISGTDFYVYGASGDCRRLYGVAEEPVSQKELPCYWTITGQQVFGSIFADLPTCTPRGSDKSGQAIVGELTTALYIPDYGDAHMAFRWDTTTNQVRYFFPSGFLTTSPTFISPNGNVVQFGGWLDPVTYKQMIYDFAEPSKGYQNVEDWLIEHNFLKPSDLGRGRDFAITGMSDSMGTLLGYYTFNQVDKQFFLASSHGTL